MIKPTEAMGHENVTEFILLELFTDENVKVACFVMFLLCYIAILSGNLLILLTIRGSHLSEQPMYFFLSYLSLMDVCFTSTVAPKLITASKPSRRPSPTTAAWPRCFMPTSLEPLRSSSWWPWPMTVMSLSADLFTTWSS